MQRPGQKITSAACVADSQCHIQPESPQREGDRGGGLYGQHSLGAVDEDVGRWLPQPSRHLHSLYASRDFCLVQQALHPLSLTHITVRLAHTRVKSWSTCGDQAVSVSGKTRAAGHPVHLIRIPSERVLRVWLKWVQQPARASVICRL